MLPNWWTGIYPLTYYFIGCYLREYKVKISKWKNIILFLLVLLISSAVNIYLSFGNVFNRGIHNDWTSILNVATTTLLFVFIINLKLDNINLKVKKIIVKISELSLAAYLCSVISDNFLYFHYFKNINLLSTSGYFKVVPLVFVLSIAISFFVNLIYKGLNKLSKKVIEAIKNIIMKYIPKKMIFDK